ncbi:hypothetical protein EDD21DRAFT_90894, partial [Dissophora ornata]
EGKGHQLGAGHIQRVEDSGLVVLPVPSRLTPSHRPPDCRDAFVDEPVAVTRDDDVLLLAIGGNLDICFGGTQEDLVALVRHVVDKSTAVLYGPAEGRPEFFVGSLDVVFANALVGLEAVLQRDEGTVRAVAGVVTDLLALVVGVGFFRRWKAINVQNELLFLAKFDELMFELTMGIVGVSIGVAVCVPDGREMGTANIDPHLGGEGRATWLVMDVRRVPLVSE